MRHHYTKIYKHVFLFGRYDCVCKLQGSLEHWVSLSGSQEYVRVFQILLWPSYPSSPFEHFFFKSFAFPRFFFSYFSSTSFFFFLAWQRCLVIFPVFNNCFLGKDCLHWESSEAGHLKTLLQVESSKKLPDRSIMTVLWESSFLRVSTPF